MRRPPPHANGLFDLQNRYASLSEAGDPLERLNAVIDWEMFRSILSRIDPTERKSAAGRKPTCRVLIFKMLILQRLRNLSDERLQYPVSDRLSLMRFLDLELAGNVPDDRTLWAFRKALKQHPLTDALFERLNQALSNTEKLHVRAQVEHVLGAMENDMVGIFLRSMGAARAKVGVGLMNLTYNLKRIETLIRLKVFDFDRIGAPVAQAMA
uniref:transposase n=2 Tax=Candidatus Nitrotoga sp. BS TaxID=2890408 RepID=UPI001EF38963|nr:transposase [Candidatus Nitrotoga sp. BS]